MNSARWGQRLILETTPHAQRLNRLEYVVNPDDLAALLHRLERERHAPPQALVCRRLPRQRADGALAAGADHDRATKRVKQCEAVHQRQIVRDALAEAK